MGDRVYKIPVIRTAGVGLTSSLSLGDRGYVSSNPKSPPMEETK